MAKKKSRLGKKNVTSEKLSRTSAAQKAHETRKAAGYIHWTTKKALGLSKTTNLYNASTPQKYAALALNECPQSSKAKLKEALSEVMPNGDLADVKEILREFNVKLSVLKEQVSQYKGKEPEAAVESRERFMKRGQSEEGTTKKGRPRGAKSKKKKTSVKAEKAEAKPAKKKKKKKQKVG